MDRQKAQDVVLTVLTNVLKCKVDVDTSRQNTPQWDSLKNIEIVFAVEDNLNIEFTEEQLASLDSVAKIVDFALISHEA
jgi:acyl carrier protein